ncbi:uncharacterized protein LOC129918874 [Episyrphus balteatus]|uniref:uncharacterized protein LOC129918874 n=1 Tax=Episyrphus balteatus TaxID=286459 RepID=UPI00248532E5|nr:uncharacterized protein LOC129918874 [Episyrphus balteatus]
MSSPADKKHFKKPFQKFRNNNGQKHYGGNKFKQAGHKNKRFFQNAKGFGKKGSYGRGTHIEEEDFTYFMGILETQRNSKFQSADEKVAMANNVLEQTKEKEIHLASNQVVSRVLENCLGFCDPEHLEGLFDIFGEGVRPICSDQHASHVLEKLLETAAIRALGEAAISSKKDEDASNPPKKGKFEVVHDYKYNMTHEFDEAHREKCSAFFLRISKFLLNNLEEFVEQTYANHLLRSAILGLSGLFIPKSIYYKGKMVTNLERLTGTKQGHRQGELLLMKTIFQVPAEWKEVLMEFPERLQMWPQYKDLPYKYITSGLLQVICLALDTVDKKALEDFGKKLITDCFINVVIPKKSNDRFNKPKNDNGADVKEEENGNGNDEEAKMEADDEEQSEEQAEPKEDEEQNAESAEADAEEENDNDDKPSVFKSDSSIYVLQTLITVASPSLMTQISDLFKDRLLTLANGKMSSYAVERLINYVADKSLFEKIFEELAPHFEKFYQTEKSSLVSAMSATCLRLKDKQAAFITTLQNSLRCNAQLGAERPKSFFVCLTKLKPFEVLPYDQRKYISIYGSLIIQDILQFNKPILLVNSILETPVKDLNQIMQLPNGGYIADKFLMSTTIGEKSREKLIKLFEGFYMDLAISPAGSRVLEKFVKAANDGQKVAIATELTARDNKLKGNAFGRIVYNSLRLETFKLSQDQWKASWKEGAVVEAEEVVKEETVVAPKEEPAAAAAAAEEMDTTETTTKPSPASAKKNNKKNNKKRPAS